MHQHPIADFRHVTVSYGKEDVLKDITFKIEEREHCAILGPNGSGKSTLIKLFAQDLYNRALPGSFRRIFGQETWSIWDLKKKLGIITNDLHNRFTLETPEVTGLEAVISGYYSSLGQFRHQKYTTGQKKKAEEILEFLHIPHLRDRKIREMSTGEIRRCVIGRALVHDPRAILLDEPTVGLDIKAQFEFLQTMRKIANKATVILVTHHLEEIIPEICTVALLKEGSLYRWGPKEEVLTEEHLSHVFNMKLHLHVSQESYRVFPEDNLII